MSAVAVLLPCQNQRHVLWRSLASLAAQTRPPDQILVLDRGSTDGLADWLLAQWPGVEICAIELDADEAVVAERLDAAVTAEKVAVLPPGERWNPDHLRLLDDTQALCPKRAMGDALAAADRDDQGAVEAEDLDEALATLGVRFAALAVDLRAAASPLDLIGLLGLALHLHVRGGPVRALTLAELTWPAIEEDDPGTPLLVSFGGTLDLDHAGEQLCIEQLIRSRPKAPVRLLLGSLRPTTTVMLSRLLDAVAKHGDVELWLTDPIARRYAASLFGCGRVRRVSPPIDGLAEVLHSLAIHPAVHPAMLGEPAEPRDPLLRTRSHADWWAGYDVGAVRRLGPVLAGLVGMRAVMHVATLQRAWLTTLVGWSALCGAADTPPPPDPLLRRFVRMCGQGS
ncbi:MAG: glycosyltransferase family 2 protein [Geminicoccaceae bacterium]